MTLKPQATLVAIASILAVGLAACGTSSDNIVVGSTEVTSNSADGAVSLPGASIGGSVGVLTIAPADTPPAAPDPAQDLFGPWTMARSGDRVCTIDLGSRNAVGDYSAKTRKCSSVELARTALWTYTPAGIVLYDFERRPVATLSRQAPDLYEGTLAGGIRVTLWR